MGNRHVQMMRGEGSPQFKHRFELTLPLLPTVEGASQSSPFADPLIVGKLSRRVISLSPLVEYTREVQSSGAKNSKWYYFDGDDVSAFTISFMEMQDQLTLEYFLYWQALQIVADGRFAGCYYPPFGDTGYKKDLAISIQDGFDNTLRTLFQRGCFPSQIAGQGLDYQSSDPLSIDVTFTYDGTETERHDSTIQQLLTNGGSPPPSGGGGAPGGGVDGGPSNALSVKLEADGVRNPFTGSAEGLVRAKSTLDQLPSPNENLASLERSGTQDPFSGTTSSEPLTATPGENMGRLEDVGTLNPHEFAAEIPTILGPDPGEVEKKLSRPTGDFGERSKIQIPDFNFERDNSIGIPVLSALRGNVPQTAAGAALAALAR